MAVELIGVEIEEFVEQLRHGLGVAASLLGQIILLNNLKVSFKESIGLGEAINLARGILCFVAGPRSSALAFKQINRHWIASCSLVLPIPDLFLLKTWEDRRIPRLQERDNHQSERIRGEISISGTDNVDLLGPVLDEYTHDVETLIYLAVGVDKVRIVNGKDIVHIKIYL